MKSCGRAGSPRRVGRRTTRVSSSSLRDAAMRVASAPWSCVEMRVSDRGKLSPLSHFVLEISAARGWLPTLHSRICLSTGSCFPRALLWTLLCYIVPRQSGFARNGSVDHLAEKFRMQTFSHAETALDGSTRVSSSTERLRTIPPRFVTAIEAAPHDSSARQALRQGSTSEMQDSLSSMYGRGSLSLIMSLAQTTRCLLIPSSTAETAREQTNGRGHLGRSYFCDVGYRARRFCVGARAIYETVRYRDRTVRGIEVKTLLGSRAGT